MISDRLCLCSRMTPTAADPYPIWSTSSLFLTPMERPDLSALPARSPEPSVEIPHRTVMPDTVRQLAVSYRDQIADQHRPPTDTASGSSPRWHLEWDLRLTPFSKNHMSLEYAEIRGRTPSSSGDISPIRCTIGYRYNNSFKHCTAHWDCDTLEEGLLWIWRFLEEYTLCRECGDLLKTGESCRSCLFFQGYMEFMNRQEICAICQDPVYRCRLPCGHMFHRLCINKMEFSPDIRCPLCRADIPFDVICELFDKGVGDIDGDDDESSCYDSDDEEDEIAIGIVGTESST